MTSLPPSILIFIPWFGAWPAWMRFFLESCRHNPTIDWVLISDCGDVTDLPPNVRILSTSLLNYRELISQKIGIRCKWVDAYKLCDLRPSFGVVHDDLITGYDYWGYGDIDLIYGDIRSIYNGYVLSHDVISSHANITAGHLTLIKNTEKMNLAFKKVRGWKGLLSRRDHRGFDEYQWSHLFKRGLGTRWLQLKQRIRSPDLQVNGYFVEQFTTDLFPLPWIDGSRNYPRKWYWKDGKLTAEGAGSREFLYVHFTHWQSNRWVNKDKAAWRKLDNIDGLPPGRPREFTISADGFRPLNECELTSPSLAIQTS